jgi:two-component system response regulator AtoC
MDSSYCTGALQQLLDSSAGRPTLEPNPPVLPDFLVFGRSSRMLAVRQNLQRVAVTNVPALIRGESGTGKEVIARLIHDWSPWRQGPFIKVNCPAISGALVGSVLFGSERTVSTVANGSNSSTADSTQNGTLFLDEIAELEPSLQAKLLQFLQDGQFCPVGGRPDKHIDARVVCATNQELEAEVRRGAFRHDLFYRINVVTIHLPSLRERPEDIPIISDALRLMYGERFARPTKPISPQKLEVMQQYRWPGNIRELENLIKRYVILGSEDAIDIEGVNAEISMPTCVLEDSNVVSLKKVTREATRALENQIIAKALQTHNWNRRRAASALHISYRALLYKLKDAGFPAHKGAKNVNSGSLASD